MPQLYSNCLHWKFTAELRTWTMAASSPYASTHANKCKRPTEGGKHHLHILSALRKRTPRRQLVIVAAHSKRKPAAARHRLVRVFTLSEYVPQVALCEACAYPIPSVLSQKQSIRGMIDRYSPIRPSARPHGTLLEHIRGWLFLFATSGSLVVLLLRGGGTVISGQVEPSPWVWRHLDKVRTKPMTLRS